jgi:hypothetical protein
MELKSLYRVRFAYSEEWGVGSAGADSKEGQYYFVAEGRCEGRIAGRFQGTNHPRRRGDGTFLPDFQGIIHTDDGAVIYFDYRGYGRSYPVGRRQIVIAGTHLTDDERYQWLNDSISVGVGEVRARPGQASELVIDWAELIWQPIAE